MTIQIKSIVDVTDKLLKNTSKAIVEHLAQSISAEPTDTILYSEVDILNIHYLEKAKKSCTEQIN